MDFDIRVPSEPTNSIAIGYRTCVGKNAIAIGTDVVANDNEIIIGNDCQQVKIAGIDLIQENKRLQARVDILECHINALMDAIKLPD